VEQSAYRVPKEHKRHLLAHLIKEGNWHQVLVFTRTKHGANRLTQQLERAGINAMAIHGNKSQNARVKALQDFKDNRITALVATEVAARGLDIKELPHVVNYELPNVPEDYVHRIGRTARAGSTGAAVSLVSPDEVSLLKDIEKVLKRQIEFAATPKFEIAEGTTHASSHTPRAESREPGEYQPHQDPRRSQQRRQRPQHGGGRSQRGGGRGGHGGRGDAGRAAHDSYAEIAHADNRAPDSSAPKREDSRPPHHGGGQQRTEHRGQGHGGKPQGARPPGGNRDKRGGGRGKQGGNRSGRGGFARGARSSGGRSGGGSSGGAPGGFTRMN
jgi:ATP-dependent RNA helicase RhlE